MLTMVAAILALTIFIPMPIDELGTKPDCKQVEKNDELYLGLGKGDCIQDCRTKMIENLTGEDE